MSSNADRSLDQAIAWHLAHGEPGFDRWEEFTAWLESAPEHRAAYDRLAQVDALLGRLDLRAASLAADNAPLAMKARRLRWPAAAIAAALLAVIGLNLMPAHDAPRSERTAAGEIRQIALQDGTSIALNGDSQLDHAGRDVRTFDLEHGEALFTVRHGEGPFVVNAGGIEIRDLGTVFDVSVSDDRVEVAVREGAVLVDPAGANMAVSAGEAISYDRQKRQLARVTIPQVGSWVNGELAFEDSDLSSVVAALHRRSGIEVRLSPALKNAPFTGNVKLSGDEEGIVAHLAALIGADYRRVGKAWELSARHTGR